MPAEHPGRLLGLDCRSRTSDWTRGWDLTGWDLPGVTAVLGPAGLDLAGWDCGLDLAGWDLGGWELLLGPPGWELPRWS